MKGTIKVKINPAKKKVKKKTVKRTVKAVMAKPVKKKVIIKRTVKKNPVDISASERLFLRKLLRTISADYEFTGRDKVLIEGLKKKI